MKKFVETLPTLIAPIHGEVLMMYLAALTESISAALFVRREKGHVSIYFVSKVLQGAELNYPALEKLILALDDSNKETPKDFLIKAPLEDNKKEVERKTDTKLEETKPSCEWKLYTDGASSSNGLGTGLMLIDPEGKEYTYAMCIKFETTNNEAGIIQDCEKCKEQSVVKKRAEIEAIAAGNAWPFSYWGVKILGPLSTAPRGLKFLAIAIEHSTKWIEAKPQTTINLCRGLTITQSFSPITEHMEIMNRIEKQLARRQQGWVDDLSQVLWVHRTLPRNNHEEIPFSLTYGSEAIIPTIKSIVVKDGRGRTKEVTKRKESKEIA
uniref:Reverse transcriptase domain-containing protein n=1 Tax=Tanacetum cinerariifolium TaxID=118510 RepID=A0A6L2JJ79_TANCI|nr:hypothetical protein [Tanacetum cinerariifolium]